MTPSELREEFDIHKIRTIGLLCGEEIVTCVKPFRYDAGTWRTDGRTDIIPVSIPRVSMLMRDNNTPATATHVKECTQITINCSMCFLYIFSWMNSVITTSAIKWRQQPRWKEIRQNNNKTSRVDQDQEIQERSQKWKMGGWKLRQWACKTRPWSWFGY